MTEQKQGITFVNIPGEVAFNKKLNQTDGFVFWMVKTLDTSENHCWASNDFIAKKLNVSTTTISTSISKLKEQGYIKQISFDGRKRILAIDNSYHEKYRYLIEKYNTDEKSLKGNLKAAFKETYKQPLKKLKAYNNKDNNKEEIIINDNISGSRSAHDSSDNQSDNQPVKINNSREKLLAERLINYWSNLGYTTNHSKKPDTKLYQSMIKKLICLQKGTFKNLASFDPDWISKKEIPEIWFTQAWTYNELKDGLILASRYAQEGYWPEDKSFYRSLDNILLSIPYIHKQKQPGVSWLFTAIKNPPISIKQTFQKIPFEATVNKLIKNPIWPKDCQLDKFKLGVGLKELDNFSKKLIRDSYNKSHQYFGTLALLLKEYLAWIDENDWIEINQGIIGANNGVFRKFIEAQSKEIGIQIKSKGWK